MESNYKNRKVPVRGFTLVELMVSLAVFSIVMTVSVGTLLVLVDLNAKAQALYSASTNLSFALDSMSREMRTGYRYNCGESNSDSVQNLPDEGVSDDCDIPQNPSGTLVAFSREEDGKQMGYRLNTADHSIEQKERGGNWVRITAEEVYIEVFEVTVRNSDLNDNNQPTVDLRVEGYVNNGLDTDTDFFIQTHIVQRRIDIL